MMTKVNNILQNIFHNQTICILGVDGTGKSSATALLKKLLGQNTEIQYMGFHSYLTKLARIRFRNGIHGQGIISVIMNFAVVFFEMWYRVIHHWPYERIIIYDRYAWEYYVSLGGAKKAIAKLAFKTLFPNPRYVFYLYCPTDVSLARKTDIEDIKAFIQLKNSYDKEFMSFKRVITIDTSINDMAAVISIILKHLPKSYISHVTGE